MRDWPNLSAPHGRIRFGLSHVPPCPRKRKRQQIKHWEVEKPKLDAANQLRGIFDIPLEDTEHDNIVEKESKELERPEARNMPRIAQHQATP